MIDNLKFHFELAYFLRKSSQFSFFIKRIMNQIPVFWSKQQTFERVAQSYTNYREIWEIKEERIYFLLHVIYILLSISHYMILLFFFSSVKNVQYTISFGWGNLLSEKKEKIKQIALFSFILFYLCLSVFFLTYLFF